ncbi:MFS transporter [Ruegeria hyattellae]|uniref:MFS transporter n=1 Tax=Ruegeria hyattellae TaxID=3233337 RepID=UPI00355BE365
MTDLSELPESPASGGVSWHALLTGSHAAALALICLSVWLHAADSLMVATMLPAIVAEVGGAALVGWSVSLYEIGSIIAGSASALLAMRHGLRRPMICAASLFAAGCLASALSPTMPLLLTGRLLQGLGGGGLVALGFVAAGVIFPRSHTARVMAAISTLWGVSAFIGPLIAALFVEYASWRWGFAFFGLQAVALALWIMLRPEPDAARGADAPGRFPLKRLALLSAGVVLVASAGVEIGALRTPALMVAGLTCLAAFLWLDGRAVETRLLPLAPFDLRQPTGAALLMILGLSMATIAITAFGPLLITAIHDAAPLAVGYIIVCSSVGWTLTAVLVSGSPERYDRLFIALGMSFVCLSIPGFLYAVPRGPLWLIAMMAVLEGGGFGMAWTFILRRCTALAPSGEVQRVSGAIPTVQRAGYALGAVCVGMVANATGFLELEREGTAATVSNWVFLACIPFAMVGLAAMVMFIRERPPAQAGCPREDAV